MTHILQYDYIIIGGGISGLYCALLLDILHKGKILVVEKDDVFGGRVQTISSDYTINSNHFMQNLEMGAGRFTSTHKNMFTLLNYLDMKDKITPGSQSKKYFVHDNFLNKISLDSQSEFYKIIAELITLKNNNDNSILTLMKSKSLYDFIKLYLDYDKANIILTQFGYDDDIIYQNAFDAIEMFETDFNASTTYHFISGGMSQIINKIIKCLSSNVSLLLNNMCHKILLSGNNYKCLINDNMYNTKNVILTVAIDCLNKINILDMHFTESYNSVILNKPLMRVYMFFPVVNGSVWFHDIDGTLVSRKLIRQIIPIDKKTGLIMISYSDGTCAETLNKLDKSNKLIVAIMHCLRQIITDRTIPEPTKTISKYWHTGTHIWTKHMPKPDILRLMKPLDNHNIFCVGEIISPLHNWTEGSLKSVNTFIKNFTH